MCLLCASAPCGDLLYNPVNVHSQGAPDRRTLHTAEDAADDKWIFQLWLSAGLPQQQQQTQAQQQKQAGKVPVPPGVRRGAGTDKKKSVRWMR